MKSISRYASKSYEFGPLAYLKDTWTGNTGWNLMVVPQVVNGTTSFLVMVHELFETQVFTRVEAPVPNRGGAVGIESLLAVKYNQTVAENASKNVLHEEVGMWLYQTPSNSGNPGWSKTEATFPFPILRQGVIPHGNSILLSGVFEESTPPAPVFPAPYTDYLPKILTTGIDPAIEKAFIKNYEDQIKEALASLPSVETQGLSLINFINPTTLLEIARKSASNDGKSELTFDQVINLHVNSTNAKEYGGITSIPFAHSYANPVDFDAYFSIQVVKNTTYTPDIGNKQDEVPDYFQLQYFQNISIAFEIDFMGVRFMAKFPHYQLNSLIKI